MRPPTRLAGPATRDEAATGRRAAKAARKAARSRVVGNVLAQCDRCGATDDAEHRARATAHADCGGTFRLFGHAAGAAS